MINFSIEEIASILEGNIIGNASDKIVDVKPIESASKGHITFYYNEKYESFFNESNATCIIVGDNILRMPNNNQVFIKVAKPYNSFVQFLKVIEGLIHTQNYGIHKSVIIGENCSISDKSLISAKVVIGNRCEIGDEVVIKPGVVLYDNVQIGSNTVINANVTVYQNVVIGSNCIIHAGAVIGSDGFGYIENKEDGSYSKVPQLGNVVIENDVEIGANSTIDCALVGSTIIRKGSKIDNLVHIGHNCEIGENNGIAAQTGISGSVVTGNRNRFGGQVGIAGHLEINDDVIILAQSGVSKSITKKGIYFGSPIKNHLTAFKIEAVIRHLPELSYSVEKIKNDINKIKEKIGD